MEYINCNICNIDDAKFLFQAKDLNCGQAGIFNVVQCNNCGLVYLNPQLTKEEIKRFYPDSYYIEEEHQIKPDKLELLRESDKRLLGILKYKKVGKVLDIGCKRGDVLVELKALEWETWGVEISPLAAQFARQKHGLNVITGDLLDTNLPDCQFDVVLLWGTLEHLHCPFETLQEVNRIMKNGGLLSIYIPNFDSFQARIFRDKWFHLDAPRHLFQFSTRTAGILLEKTRFTLKCIDYFNFFPNYVGLRMSLLYWFGKKSREKEVNKARQGKTYKSSFLKLIFNSFCKILSIIENISKHGGTVAIYAKKAATAINDLDEK